MPKQKSKISDSEFKKSVRDFFEKQNQFKQAQSQFNELKTKFYGDMEDYFKCKNINKSSSLSYDDLEEGNLTISRVQKSKVVFDVDKLEKILEKDLSKQVIVKKYEIIDINALIAYLKECNVDPKIFKSFLNVSKEVDTKELDNLEELGKISVEQLQGCYTINDQNPYFTVSAKKGHDNGEQEW